MHNIGDAPSSNGFTQLYLDDVVRTAQGPFSTGQLAFSRYLNVQSALILGGGRHTLLSRADAFGGVAESNESNNDWARQYIWSPLTLSPGVPVTRSYDPREFTTLSGPWPNCEGFTANTVDGHYWFAFASVGDQAGSDFDIKLHPEVPSNIPQAGFGTYTAWSSTPSDHLDAVIVNCNIAGFGTYYAGVTGQESSGHKVVQFEMTPTTYYDTPGVYGPFTMGSGDIIDLHEIYGFTSGLVQIEIRPISGDANFGASLIDPSAGGVTEINAHMYGGFTDNAGAGVTQIMRVNPVAGKFHGLVIFKHGSADIGKSLTYQIIISSYPNFIANHAYGAWDGPIVPRNPGDMGVFPVTLSSTLYGNLPITSFNYSLYNDGPGTATPPYSNVLFVDDVGTWNYVPVDPIDPGGYSFFRDTPIDVAQSFVRGGRHHLRLDADTYNEVNELTPYENDNTFTDWFVWTPLELADPTSVLRGAPPASHPQGWGPYESGDGFRIPGFQGSYWTAVAMIPTSMSSDYDVRLHTASTGSKDGFGGWLSWSSGVFAGDPDFCIVNYNAASTAPRDVSVTNWNGSNANFYVQRADAPYHGSVPPGMSRYGPFSLSAHDCLNIHEFYISSGVPTYISVINLSGGVDLALYLFDGATPYHSKGTAVAIANNNGPGQSEQVGPVNAYGYFAVVVSKSNANDVDNAATYQLAFSDQGPVDVPSSGTPLPTRFALSAPRPNPTSGGALLELLVPQGQGQATVSIYDLAGRRVRTLVEGAVEPGRHALKWDGRDASGNRAAPGVYLAKLEAPHVRDTKKITLLR